MPAQLDLLFAMHERLRAKLEGEVAAIDMRCTQLRDMLAECDRERVTVERKLSALRETEEIYRADLMEPAPAVSVSGAGEMVVSPQLAGSGGQLRARVGPKRYLMLTALRATGPM